MQYPGAAAATKRRVSQKGPGIGASPSDRALHGGSQAVSTGRGGKKQLTIRAQRDGSGKGSGFMGQSYGPEHRQQMQPLVGGNRDAAEPSASGQPATQGAPSTDAGGRLDSVRVEEANMGKKKGRTRRDQSGARDQERRLGDGQGEQESKYGKDFKIPELPPLLQAQLFGPGGQAEWAQSQRAAAGLGATIGGHKPYKIKRFIDEMYQKEAKSRYHRQYVREDFLLTQSPIFDLRKYHQLRPQGELMPRGGRNRFGGLDGDVAALGLDRKGNPVLPGESQSLTNVMGFQAGGLSLLSPGNVKAANPDLQLQMMGLGSHSDLPSLTGHQLDPGAMWRVPPQLADRARAGAGTPPQLTSTGDAMTGNVQGFGAASGDAEADDMLAAPLRATNNATGLPASGSNQ